MNLEFNYSEFVNCNNELIIVSPYVYKMEEILRYDIYIIRNTILLAAKFF